MTISTNANGISFADSPRYLAGVPRAARNSTNAIADATFQSLQNLSILPFGRNGYIDVTATFSYTSSTNGKRLAVRFGGTEFLTFSTVNSTSGQRVTIRIHNVNSTSSQEGNCGSGAGVGGFNSTGTTTVTASIDTTTPQTLAIGAYWAGATLTETITLLSYSVQVVTVD